MHEQKPIRWCHTCYFGTAATYSCMSACSAHVNIHRSDSDAQSAVCHFLSNRSSLPMVQGLPAERTLAPICTLPSGRRSSPTQHCSTPMWVGTASYEVKGHNVVWPSLQVRSTAQGWCNSRNFYQFRWCNDMESRFTIVAGGWVREVPDGGPANCSTVLPLQCATKHCKWNPPPVQTHTYLYTSSLMT